MKLVLSTILSSILATTAHAQIAPMLVNTKGSPVKIVSITSTASDLLQKVTVQNISDRPVSSYQIGLVMAIPIACGTRGVASEERLLPTDRVSLLPGAESTTSNRQLAPDEIELFRRKNLANEVLSQMAVVHVDFADGGFWAMPLHDGPYDKELLERNAASQCVSSRVSFSGTTVSVSCKISPIAMAQGGGVSTYACVSGSGEACSVGEDGQSCTSRACTGGCPNQTCKYFPNGHPPVQP